MKYVSVSGIGYSGSGAVIDLLCEFERCKDACGDDEFVFAYYPDGLDDLSYHLLTGISRFHSSDIAIMRFKKAIHFLGKQAWNHRTRYQLEAITEEFISLVTQMTWKGNWIYDLSIVYGSTNKYVQYRIKRKANSILKTLKFTKFRFRLLPERTMYLSVNPDGYMELARSYIDKILQASTNCSENDVVIINQGVPANNVFHYNPYFRNLKSIIVTRDPRDMYLNMTKVNSNNALWFPHNNVKEFVEYYKIVTQGVLEASSENVLIIAFEDLIYNNKKTTSRIVDFIGNCGDHVLKGVRFRPEVSVQNTQLYKWYKGFDDDIKYIEGTLKEYLYPFDETIEISHNQMF